MSRPNYHLALEALERALYLEDRRPLDWRVDLTSALRTVQFNLPNDLMQQAVVSLVSKLGRLGAISAGSPQLAMGTSRAFNGEAKILCLWIKSRIEGYEEMKIEPQKIETREALHNVSEDRLRELVGPKEDHSEKPAPGERGKAPWRSEKTSRLAEELRRIKREINKELCGFCREGLNCPEHG